MREPHSRNSAPKQSSWRPDNLVTTSITAQCSRRTGSKHQQQQPIRMAASTWSAAEKFRNNMHMQIKTILTLVAALTVVTASSGFAHNPGGKPDLMNASLESLKGAEFEQSF